VRAAALALACGVTLAGAVETTAWPPPAGVEARMHELQAVLSSRDATPVQREAARRELAALLRNPAARAPTPDEKAPPRAAIEPNARIVKPAEGPVPPAPPVAHVEVVEPPKSLIAIPGTGTAAVPATPDASFAIDPRTGAVLHGVPGGYIDPRTGQFVPR
jgi:hypothetical protein